MIDRCHATRLGALLFFAAILAAFTSLVVWPDAAFRSVGLRTNNMSLLQTTRLRLQTPFARTWQPIMAGNKPDVAAGVTISRSFTLLPDTAKIVLNVAGPHCDQHDDFGDNVCHWDWSDIMSATIQTALQQPITADDYIEGHVKIDRFIPYHFRCALCGEACQLQLPVIKANITIPTSQNCPVHTGKHSKRLEGQLWSKSPTDELVTTTLEASLVVVQASTGTTLLELDVLAHVK